MYREMQRILARARAAVGSWVGSSVVHLGDHNVPSALHFIDKVRERQRKTKTRDSGFVL